MMLLQKPFFRGDAPPEPPKPVNAPLRALAVLFGLIHLYPGIGAILLGFDGAEDSAAMLAVGVFVAGTSAAFVAVGLRGLLRTLQAPEAMVER
jgi:hypothetical protein